MPQSLTDVTQTATVTDPYAKAAESFDQAGSIYTRLSEGQGLTNINSYMSPFYEQVIDRTLGRMATDRDKTLGQIGDQAIAAGAFGGSRHGLMEGEFLGQYNQNVGDTVAQLQMQNFNQAAEMSRADQMAGAYGLQGLGNTYFNAGNTIADRQLAAGNQQQQLLQAILSGGAQQYNQMVQSPTQMLNVFNALSANDPRRAAVTSTQQYTPGLMDYLKVAANVASAGLMGG